MPEADRRKRWLLTWWTLIRPRIVVREQYTSISEAQQDIFEQLNGLTRNNERWWNLWVQYRCAFFVEMLSFNMATTLCNEGELNISDPSALLAGTPSSSDFSSPACILYNTYHQRDLRSNRAIPSVRIPLLGADSRPNTLWDEQQDRPNTLLGSVSPPVAISTANNLSTTSTQAVSQNTSSLAVVATSKEPLDFDQMSISKVEQEESADQEMVADVNDQQDHHMRQTSSEDSASAQEHEGPETRKRKATTQPDAQRKKIRIDIGSMSLESELEIAMKGKEVVIMSSDTSTKIVVSRGA